MKAKAQQIFGGLLLGALPFALIFLLLLAMVPGGGVAAQGFATGFPIVAPFLLVASLIFALGWQSVASLVMSAKGYPLAAGCVWLIYPIVLVPGAVWFGHYQVRTWLASTEDYASRELVLPDKPIRHILVVEKQRTYKSARGPFSRDCDTLCVNVLMNGVLNSLAVPTEEEGGGYIVHRLARGEDCIVGERNEWELRTAKSNYPDVKRIFDRITMEMEWPYYQDKDRKRKIEKRYLEYRQKLARLEEPYFEGLRKPKVARVGQTSWLADRGHFDVCITYRFQDLYDYDYDIRINLGKAFKRPYGVCCQIAEIYGNRGDDLKLLARWEAQLGRPEYGPYFELREVIGRLTGRTIPRDLPLYSYRDLESELARLASLPARATHYRGSSKTTTWIEKVLHEERRRIGKIPSLSDRSIEHLLQLAPKGDAERRARFFKDIRGHNRNRFEPSSFERLMEAEARFQQSSN